MRDLRSKIQNKVLKGLSKLGTINVVCVYREMAVATYLDGEATNPILSSTPALPIAFVDFTPGRNNSTDIKHDEEPVRSIDKVAIFSPLLLAITPKKGDIIVDDQSVEWSVLGITGDPAGAHYELHIRPKVEV